MSQKIAVRPAIFFGKDPQTVSIELLELALYAIIKPQVLISIY